MYRKTAALGALLWLWLAPSLAAAQPSPSFSEAPFEITADTIDYERVRDVYVARGNVKLVQDPTTLTADWVSFSRTGGRGVASGNVVYFDGKDTVYANFVEFNITTLQGVLFLARFDDSKQRFRMEGQEIVKTGDETYTFKEGMFTTCHCPDDGKDPWQIRAESAELEIDGLAIARNTTVNVLGVPILWLPWMAYPLKTERESGLLFPEFGISGRNGFMVGLPYFWAAAPNVGVTATPRWLEKRGVKGEVEVEYLLGKRSSGDVYAAYIYDQDIDPNSDDQPYDRHRWAARGHQNLYLPHDIRLQSEFKAVSDNAYLSDFRDMGRYRRDRYLTSDVFATKNLGREKMAVIGAVRIADDIQSPDDQDRDPYMLQRFADIEFSRLPARLGWAERLVPSLDAEYIYFGQYQNPSEIFRTTTPTGDDLFYDVGIDALSDPLETGPGPDPNGDDAITGGPEGNGTFEEGEPLGDRGHRMIVHPKLAMPWRLGRYAELYPEIGWRQSFFQTRAQNTQSWGAFTARADLRTRLRSDLGTNTVHILEPRLGYALVARPDLGGEPLFVPFTRVPQQRIRQLYLDNVTRDPSDRLADFNGITWGVGNRFYSKGAEDRPARLLADFNIGAQYDFANGGQLGWFVIDGVGRPTRSTDLRLNLGFDGDQRVLEEVLAELEWRSRESFVIDLRYRYLRTIPRFFEDFRFSNDRFDDFENNFNRVSQVSIATRYHISARWTARWELAYAFENSILLSNRAAVEYLSRCNCWAAGIEVRQNRQFGFEFNVLYRIVGLGNDPTGFAEGGLDEFGFLDAF